jgi:hypothetical protein
MRIVAEITHDLPAWAESNIDRYAAGVTRAIGKAATVVKQDFRGQIEAAGLGRRLAGTIRSQVYPRGGVSPNAAALIWSKAPEIVGAHERGALIRSSSGFFLAIPTPAAGRGTRSARLTPGEWEARRGIRLRLVYRQNAPSLLVADGARLNARGLGVASRSKTGRGAATVPIFILLPQVRLRKRIDLMQSVRSLNLAGWIRAETRGGG